MGSHKFILTNVKGFTLTGTGLRNKENGKGGGGIPEKCTTIEIKAWLIADLGNVTAD